MTKRLSPERLELLRTLSTIAVSPYDVDIVEELLAHIDALEEENLVVRQLYEGAIMMIEKLTRSKTQ